MSRPKSARSEHWKLYAPRVKRSTIENEYRNLALWPQVSVENMEDAKRIKFERMKTAVDGYVGRGQVRKLFRQLGLHPVQVQRAAERCLTRHPDGRLFGYRGLLPHKNTRGYTRRKPLGARAFGSLGGFSGSLHLVFRRHKDIKARLDHYLLTGERDGAVAESHVTNAAAHAFFLALCAEHDPGRTRYPFGTTQLGKSAIRNYCDAFRDANYDAIVARQYGKTAAAKARTGTGYHSRLTAVCPFDVIEIDEHRCDFLGMIRIPTPSGRRKLTLRRVILITCTDRRSGVVLGYTVVFKREADTQDLMAAVQNALDPWEAKTFAGEGQSYDEGAGFPSGRLPELADCGWASVLFDGALIHIANPVIDRLRNRLGCDINLGPVCRFERRPVAELVFKRLEELGFHILPSTTGSNPQDIRRQDAEAKARTANITMEAVLAAIELCIAHYNAVVTARVDGVSGLDFIEQWAKDEEFDSVLPRLPKRPAHHARLDTMIEPVKVTGSQADGVRPRVYTANAHYTSTVLSERWDLIGKELLAHINPNDVRTIELFDADGGYFGTLTTQKAYWRDVRHSLNQRAFVAGLIRREKLEEKHVVDFMRRFLAGLGDDVQADAERDWGGVSDAATRVAEERRKHDIALNQAKPAPAANDPDVGAPSHAFDPRAQQPDPSPPDDPPLDAYGFDDDPFPEGLELNLTLTALN